jgi:hypothetical protein
MGSTTGKYWNRSPANARTMWKPSARARIVLASAGLGGLIVALVVSFFGPVTVLTLGPPPPGALLEAQILDVAVIVSSGLVGLALWRGSASAGLATVAGGTIAAGLGFVLGFGILLPNGYGSWYAPYSLQGAILIEWGIFVLLFGFLASSRLGRPTSAAPPVRVPVR